MTDPERGIDELPLLDAQRNAISCWWNGTTPRSTTPDDRCIHQLFEAQAAPDARRCGAPLRRRPNSPTRELDARANQLAHFLRSKGAGRRCSSASAWSAAWSWSLGSWEF